jgi:hypothetical protein
MKYCPGCGKALTYENAEICPECGCRISGFWSGNRAGFQVIAAICLVAIVILLFFIAFAIMQGNLSTARQSGGASLLPVTQAITTGTTNSVDNSLTLTWRTMNDWNGWQHVATWSGSEAGNCTEYGPFIINGPDGYGEYGEYGADVHLYAGSMESGISRTITDPTGEGWNTLTLVGRLSHSDVPTGRWMKIEVNGKVVFNADATQVPPGNEVVFTIPVHFAPSTTVNVNISNGQTPVWGGSPGVIDFYSLRLSSENDVNS